jgi:hypothetical protein
MKYVSPAYGCSAPVLYTVSRTAWNLCLENLAAFAAFKSKYTEQYVTDALTAVDNAEKMKNAETRGATQKEARIELEESAKHVCTNWQTLKR